MKLYMNYGIIAVVIGIILSIIGNFFLGLFKSIIGSYRKLSIIGQGLHLGLLNMPA